jgi:dTDP-4-dehydrorhamnose reductase
MKIAIIGSRGQLGTQFSENLQKLGFECWKFSHQEMDISNIRNVRSTLKKCSPELVINCAAYNLVDEAEKEWRTAFSINSLGPRNLAIICDELDATLVHFSSHFVFDGNNRRPYRIADSPHPLNSYGESKLFGERLVSSMMRKYYIIRVSWLFGHFGISKFNFPEKIFEMAKIKNEITMVNDQISSPSFTEDITKATLDLVKSGEYGIYHLSNSGECSKFEWAKYLLDKLGWSGNLIPSKSSDYTGFVPRPLYSTLDTYPLEDIIGYTLPHWKEANDRFLVTITDIHNKNNVVNREY